MSGLGARIAESFSALAWVFRNPGLRRLQLAARLGSFTPLLG
jgi:hypothetical protein